MLHDDLSLLFVQDINGFFFSVRFNLNSLIWWQENLPIELIKIYSYDYSKLRDYGYQKEEKKKLRNYVVIWIMRTINNVFRQ